MSNPVFECAAAYLESGISVLPLQLDGSKKPSLGSWKELQQRRASLREATEWFTPKVGIGIITGSVSGNLEVIDFDMHELFPVVFSLLPKELRTRLSVYETPGGWHVGYRCASICGNTKIAMWEPVKTPSRTGYGPCTLDGKGVRIETRGEGGYIVADGSPCAVHATGLPYCHYMGPRLEEVETITEDERRIIWETCERFDLSNQRQQMVEQVAAKLKPSSPKRLDLEKPWDWFDRVGNWDGILLPLGWKKFGDRSYTRPGKKFGVSASIVEVDGLELLKIWSSSVAESKFRSLGKFNALAEMKFNGNTSEAAKHVSQLMKEYA